MRQFLNGIRLTSQENYIAEQTVNIGGKIFKQTVARISWPKWHSNVCVAMYTTVIMRPSFSHYVLFAIKRIYIM